MSRFLRIFAFFILVFSVSAPAQAGVLEFFFPSLRKPAPDPSNTLQAPFAYDFGETDSKDVLVPQVGADKTIPMDQPHRLKEDIRDWLVEILSRAMTFEEKDYRHDLKEVLPYFSTEGWEEYKQFLSMSGMAAFLNSERYYVRSFVEEPPDLKTEGAVNGHYRWLFKVPVMVSYMDRGMTDYKKNDPKTHEMSLTVQVGRVQKSQDDMEIVIESWSGDVVSNSKK